jgi:hypothetical protein
MTDKTGGPAFMVAELANIKHDGMTLRDYFAAKAMQALIYGGWTTMDNEDCAKEAYKSADAMLKARGQ